jgi:hypothetical protein
MLATTHYMIATHQILRLINPTLTLCHMCAGASMAAAPLIALSLLAPEYQQSFAALLIGFALSETWRAPAAVLIREVSPPELGATGSALHLCIRNLVGGCGPLSKRLHS